MMINTYVHRVDFLAINTMMMASQNGNDAKVVTVIASELRNLRKRLFAIVAEARFGNKGDEELTQELKLVQRYLMFLSLNIHSESIH